MRKDPTSSVESRVTQALKRRIHNSNHRLRLHPNCMTSHRVAQSCIDFTKAEEFLMYGFPVRELRILVSSLARLYVANLTAKTMGLSGMPSF